MEELEKKIDENLQLIENIAIVVEEKMNEMDREKNEISNYIFNTVMDNLEDIIRKVMKEEGLI